MASDEPGGRNLILVERYPMTYRVAKPDDDKLHLQPPQRDRAVCGARVDIFTSVNPFNGTMEGRSKCLVCEARKKPTTAKEADDAER